METGEWRLAARFMEGTEEVRGQKLKRSWSSIDC
jgi:hypothetical protein